MFLPTWFSIFNAQFIISIELRSLKVALALPRSHHLVKLALLSLDEVQVMLGHIRAEGLARKLAVLELVNRLAQCARHARQIACGIDIALEDFRRLDFVGNAIKPGCN